jgi:hypothetical protein
MGRKSFPLRARQQGLSCKRETLVFLIIYAAHPPGDADGIMSPRVHLTSMYCCRR